MINQKGQTLLEILLAFAVAVLVLGAIVAVVITSLSNAQATKNQNLANSFAQEGIAVVRQLRDSDWSMLRNSYSNNTAYCIDPNLTLPLPSDSSQLPCSQNDYLVGGIFVRKVVFEHASPSCDNIGSKATVTVSWADSKCASNNPSCHNIQLISCFFPPETKSI